MKRIFAFMNVGLICIGSNTEMKQNIERCGQLLEKDFPGCISSLPIETPPYGEFYTTNFTNQLIIIKTTLNLDQVIDRCKKLEQLLGRTDADKSLGIIRIDIDLLKWNKKILKPADLNRNYIQSLLSQLKFN